MPVATTKVFAPGARVVIRDEEWIVRSATPASFGGLSVKVTGTSELVRSKDANFLTDLDEITELRPEETTLVPDDSPRYRRSRLYLESLLRRTPPTDDALYVGHRGAIKRADYQLQPAAKALSQLRPRILMADGVGLGKTIEVGILLSELIRRGRGDRILVVALKSILAQFQQELWSRFTIPLVRLDSVGLQRVQTRIPSNMNPFYFYNRVIISIDTLKKDAKYFRYLEQCHWDVVVVDECQNVALRVKGDGAQASQRARLAKLLARTCDGLILTSATPHDGRAESFASLMQLLEPTAIVDKSNYTRDEVEELFLRRFKKDVAHEVEDSFQDRKLDLVKESASPQEDMVFAALSEIEFRTIDRQRKTKGVLFRTLLLKSFLSSPAACIATIDQRLKHKALQEEDAAAAHDRQVLGDLRARAEAVTPKVFSKYRRLVSLLQGLGIGQADNDERVVIFSERIDTLEFLRERLIKDLGLKKNQLEVFHGSLDDQDQKRLVQEFGTKSTSMRILLGSDAASEGINLHFFCHRMVHFDLPWSLITLEQRNGRIDRFGQTEQPEISYLLTIPNDPDRQGDLRILERLIEKEHMANKNLGDVAWLMGLHEAELEEDQIGRGIEDRRRPDEIIPDEPAHTDFMEMIFGKDAPKEPPPKVNDPPTLFADDLTYAREALEEILGKNSTEIEWHDHLNGFSLRAPEDLQKRFAYLPDELQNRHGEFKLTADRARVMEAIEKAREAEDRWPEWHLFWELHPIAEWLNDRVLASFERHEAPVMRMARGLEADERIVLFEGVLSNQRSRPVLVEWFGIRFKGHQPAGTVTLQELLERTGLNRGISNPSGGLDAGSAEKLTSLLQPSVERALTHMHRIRQQRAEAINLPLREGHQKLARWKDKALKMLDSLRQLTLSDGAPLRKDQQRRLDARQHEINSTFEERKRWIEEEVRTVKEPYLRVAAVLVAQAD